MYKCFLKNEENKDVKEKSFEDNKNGPETEKNNFLSSFHRM